MLLIRSHYFSKDEIDGFLGSEVEIIDEKFDSLSDEMMCAKEEEKYSE